jgi:hypothetical protein
MTDVVIVDLSTGNPIVTTRNYTAEEVTVNATILQNANDQLISDAKARVARQLVDLTNAINAAAELDIQPQAITAARALFNSIKNLTISVHTLSAAEIIGDAIDSVLEQLKPSNLQ